MHVYVCAAQRSPTCVVRAEQHPAAVQRHALDDVRHVPVGVPLEVLQVLEPARQRPDLERLVAAQDEPVLEAGREAAGQVEERPGGIR